MGTSRPNERPGCSPSLERPGLWSRPWSLPRAKTRAASRTPQALAAIQALVASAIAHSNVPAVGTCRRVSLKMGNGVAQAGYRPSMVRTVSVANAIAESVVTLFCFDQNLGLLSDGEFRDRPVHFFFEFLHEVGPRQRGLA